MWSWTTSVSSLRPFHKSDDYKTKVYEVIAYTLMGHDVIVKQEECENEESATRAMDEGRVVKANPHPNICECLEVLSEIKQGGGFYVYIISPKMPKSLEEEICERIRRRNSFTEEQLWKLARQLISAYTFLQTKVTLTQNIAHRNIEPRNILLDSGGNVKVCDFGYAKVIDLSGPPLSTLQKTFPFFSPALRTALISGEKDISKAQHNVFKSDVYSLGVTLAYATIFEIPPFITNLNHLQENINTRLRKIKNYSESWVNLLKQMLTVNEVLRPDFVRLSRIVESPLWLPDD